MQLDWGKSNSLNFGIQPNTGKIILEDQDRKLFESKGFDQYFGKTFLLTSRILYIVRVQTIASHFWV